MRILHVARVRNRINGITAVVEALSSAQSKLGNEISILNFFPGGEEIDNFKKCSTFSEFTQQIKDFKPDVVIFHGVVFKGFNSFSKYLSSQNIPFLIQLHGAYSRENYAKSKLKKMVYKNLILKHIAKRSKGWIFLNQAEADNFTLKNWNCKSYFIPNGCVKHRDERIKAFSKNAEIKFLFLSRIHLHHKGIDLLLDALMLLAKEGFPNGIKFIFCGNGLKEDVDEFEKRITPLEDYVEFRGPVYGKQKQEILESSDIFILTSRYEGFPMSVLEALSYGCPCLVSEGTNVGDIISKFQCGWITPNLTAQAIASTIRKSVSDYRENYQVLRKNALSASEEFDWEKIGLQTIELYNTLIS